jgi:nitrous oxide reductase accessory protein NosL
MNRRTFVVAVAAGGIASGLSGCLGVLDSGDDGSVPDPVDLSGDKVDDEGGMQIGPHGGPNGQIYYADNSPAGHDNPAWFHTLSHGLFPYHFDRLDRGWDPEVIYVTDYSATDYQLIDREGGTYMPSPTDPDTFADAEGLTYVIESEVLGGMGPDLFPFSADGDAEGFTDEHGGRTIGFDDIDRTLVEALRQEM